MHTGNARWSINGKGQVILKLKPPWKDRTTHLVLEPLVFMQRLVALVPRPRLHLLRFHGVLAPNAKLRSKAVAGCGEEPSCAHSALLRMSSAHMLKRVFDIEMEGCQCGGKLKFIAVIEPPDVIEKNTHAPGPKPAAAADCPGAEGCSRQRDETQAGLPGARQAFGLCSDERKKAALN